MKLVLACNNAKKLAELQALFDGVGVTLVGQGELGVGEADEPHVTFIENALAKARHASAATGLPAISDDSGLCVDALGGAPGVVSATYATVAAHAGDALPREVVRAAQDAANNALLLARLVDADDRRAAFVCTLVAIRAADDPQPLVAIGRWDGEILRAAQGAGGFGYDPLMFVPALGATVAELAKEVKNAHSHRAIAATQMRTLLRQSWRLGRAGERMNDRMTWRLALLALVASLSGTARAQADLLAPLHGPMSTPVRTPQDADAVCTSVLVAQFVEQTIERAGAAGKPALGESDAMAQLAADPSWASRSLPTIHAICQCAIGRMVDGGSDLLGRLSARDSAQEFVRALQQPDIHQACIESTVSSAPTPAPAPAPASAPASAPAPAASDSARP